MSTKSKTAALAVSDILKSNNVFKVKSSSKKAEVPIHEGYESKADSIAEAYEKHKQAEAEFRSLEGDFLTEAQALYKDHAVSGKFTKALDFPGTKTAGIQVVWQDKFSALSVESEKDLRSRVKDFDKYFEEKRNVVLSVTDDKTVAMLIEKLGKATFERIFQITVTITAKEDMDRKQFDLPKDVQSMLKQTKPAVRIRKG